MRIKNKEQYLTHSVYSINISDYVPLYRQTKTEAVIEHLIWKGKTKHLLSTFQLVHLHITNTTTSLMKKRENLAHP